MSGDAPPPLHPVLVLTEEELLVLTDGDLGVVPPRIHLPTDRERADLVASVATRSLMARGLITPGTAEDEPRALRAVPDASGAPGPAPEAVPWDASEPLGLTLGLRALAPVVLTLHRVLGELEARHVPGQPPASFVATRYLHLHREVAVIEDVTTDGMHGLLTVFPDRYTEAVSDFIVPPDAVAGTGGERTLTDAPGERSRGEPITALMAELGHPTTLVEVAMLRTGLAAPQHDPEGLMLALGTGGTFRSEDSRTYHPVDPARAVKELVARALRGVPASPGTPQGSGAGGGPT